MGAPLANPLDNPIWHALTTRQKSFAEAANLARRFPPEVTSLGGFEEPSRAAFDSLATLQSPGGATALFLREPTEVPPGLIILSDAPLLQMVQENRGALSPAAESIALTEADVPEMLALAELTKPGPFGRRTRELGDYLGVRLDGRLAAMAGERLRVPGYTEISAVCTHSDFAGRGLAGSLMSVLIERIRNRGEVPILHVRPENRRAMELYKRLGFTERIVFRLVVVRNGAE